MKKIIISGWFGSGNAGDEAILLSEIKMFKRFLPKAKITVLSENPTYTKRLQKVEGIKFSLTNLIKILKTIKPNDIFILGGGGLVQDQSSVLNIPYHLIKIILALLLNLKIGLLFVGIGPVNSKLNRILTKIILNKVKVIVVRDENSKIFLRELKIKVPILVGADPTIFLKPKKTQKCIDLFNKIREKEITKIGIALRSFGYMGTWFYLKKKILKYNRDFQFSKFKRKISKICDWLIDNYKANIIFLDFYPDRDNKIAKEIISRMKNKDKTFIFTEWEDPSELLYVIKNLDILIGMRLHSLIFSSAVGTPFIGINYAPKIENFVNSLNLQSCLINLNKINIKTLKNKLEKILSKKVSIKNTLLKKIKNTKNNSEKTFSYFLRTLSNYNENFS